MSKFRFEDLEIWQLSIDIADKILNIADELEKKNLFRFSEQLRGAVLSISNNIAEGSGSDSKKDFAKFLNISHRSAFETVNILMILKKRGFLSEEELNKYLDDIDVLCRKIITFKNSLFK